MGYSSSITSLVKGFLKEREVPFVAGNDNFYVCFNHHNKEWTKCIDNALENPFQVYVSESTIDSLKNTFGVALNQILK